MSSEQNSVINGIHKLEAIGKKGKLSKIIKLTIQHFEYLKQSLNEFSIKILAYIIKGFFLAIKKSYENFNRDLESFIEFNIKGIQRKMKKEVKKETGNANVSTSDIFTIQNLSLYSENNQFENFLNDTNMSDKINKTLKRINKKFLTVDFSSMTEEKKKDYLKKNFIQPLTESLPMNYDFFQNSNIEQCISVNENFANYIQFDLKTIAGDLFDKTKSDVHQNQVNNKLEENFDLAANNINLTQASSTDKKNLEFCIEEIIISKKISVKNPYLCSDTKIEFNIENFLKDNEIFNKSGESHYLNILQKNFKSILLAENLYKFRNNLFINEKEKYIFYKHRDILLSDKYEGMCRENMGPSQLRREYFRGDSEKANKNSNSQIIASPYLSRQSISSKMINDIASAASIKNIFDNNIEIELYPSQKGNMRNDSDLKMRVDLENDYKDLESVISDKQNNSSKETKKSNKEEIENVKLVNSEIQNLIASNFETRKNFEEFRLENLSKSLKLNLTDQNSMKRASIETFKSECTLVFYNMLMITQIKQFSLRQNSPFGNLYLIKI